MKALQKRSQKTAEKILLTAEKMLNKDPYVELTIPHLVKEAGVSVGGFYGRFSSREELFVEVFSRYRDRRNQLISKLVTDANTQALSLNEKVNEVAKLFVSLHSNDVGVLRSFIMNNWLTPDVKPDEHVEIEISQHIDDITNYLAVSEPNLQQHEQQLKRCLMYLISLSKDHIVIKPSSIYALNSINLQELASDITIMICALISEIREEK